MSIQSDEPMSQETMEVIKDMFGDHVTVVDDQMILLEKMNELRQEEIETLEYKVRQKVDVKTHDLNDVIEMSDGTNYQVTKNGWKKI